MQNTKMITQTQIASFLIDSIGYSEQDIADFNDPTSQFFGRLQDILDEQQQAELVAYYNQGLDNL